jgi:hypothetical protein
MVRRFMTLVVLLVALTVIPHGNPVLAQDQRCFPETNQCIGGVIRQYWERNGGLPVFGFPITALAVETNADGFTGPTQWFERDRLEDHGGTVMAGRLGAQKLAAEGRPWEGLPKVSSAGQDCLFFAVTGHSLCPPFRAYWERNGGLARFGYPISEPGVERNAAGFSGTTQWFERRRMEAHPENRPPFNILLGLLGSEVRAGTPPPAGGAISGQVRFRGTSIGGILLELRQCLPDSCEVVMTTTTDGAGNYRFSGVPALPADQVYYVQFSNDLEPGSPEASARLAVWFGREINRYAAGDTADGGSFDIANVELIAPSDQATLSLPATFSWSRRGIAGDLYSVGFAPSDAPEVCYSSLSDQTSLVVDQAFLADCGLEYGTPYDWYVYVADQDWTTGFGISYNYHVVRFAGVGNLRSSAHQHDDARTRAPVAKGGRSLLAVRPGR